MKPFLATLILSLFFASCSQGGGNSSQPQSKPVPQNNPLVIHSLRYQRFPGEETVTIQSGNLCLEDNLHQFDPQYRQGPWNISLTADEQQSLANLVNLITPQDKDIILPDSSGGGGTTLTLPNGQVFSNEGDHRFCDKAQNIVIFVSQVVSRAGLSYPRLVASTSATNSQLVVN